MVTGDLVKRLREPPSGGNEHYGSEAYRRKVLAPAADALEAAERDADKFEQLDAEAATHVESVICMRSGHFTGEPPYVGWKGLGKALSEDYDDLAKAKAALEAAERVIRFVENDDQFWTSPPVDTANIIATSPSGNVLIYGSSGRRARDWLARHATGQKGGDDDQQ